MYPAPAHTWPFMAFLACTSKNHTNNPPALPQLPVTVPITSMLPNALVIRSNSQNTLHFYATPHSSSSSITPPMRSLIVVYISSPSVTTQDPSPTLQGYMSMPPTWPTALRPSIPNPPAQTLLHTLTIHTTTLSASCMSHSYLLGDFQDTLHDGTVCTNTYVSPIPFTPSDAILQLPYSLSVQCPHIS